MLTPREIADQLSIREFVALCGLLDKKRPAVTALQGSGPQTIAGGKIVRRFDVLDVQRHLRGAVTVLVEVEGTAQPLQCELKKAA